MLTTPGLGGLKQLIIEATERHRELAALVAADERTLERRRGRLSLAQAFIIRLFTLKLVPRLAQAVWDAEQDLVLSQADLDGCYVEVDYDFDEASRRSYEALARAFDDLRACEGIWDITSFTTINRVAQRTVASAVVSRMPVSLGVGQSQIVRSAYPILQFGNVGGRDIQFFPGFVSMRDSSGDFGLIEHRELSLKFVGTDFLEEEHVPSDAQQVGYTWKKANKDGSRDLRFNDNHQIPILAYGELELSSPTGLREVYMFSRRDSARQFHSAYETCRRALASPAGAAHPLPDPDPADFETDDSVVEPDAGQEAPPPPRWLWLDRIALAFLILAILSAVFWIRSHAAGWEAFLKAITTPSVAPSQVQNPPSTASTDAGSQPQEQEASAAPAIGESLAPVSSLDSASSTAEASSTPENVPPPQAQTGDQSIDLTQVAPDTQPTLRTSISHALDSGDATPWQSEDGRLSGVVTVSREVPSDGRICRTVKFTVVQGAQEHIAPYLGACFSPGHPWAFVRYRPAGSTDEAELPPF